jgi:hypothetical protein
VQRIKPLTWRSAAELGRRLPLRALPVDAGLPVDERP